MYKGPLIHSLLCSEFVELTLYYSPRSMTKDKKGNPTLPKWDFSKLKEIYVDGVRTSYIRMYNYKETKKKGQKQ